MKDKIIAGLKSLDLKSDAQWTQEGLVNLNAFKFILSGEAVTREQLEEAAPGFTRESAATYFESAASEGALKAQAQYHTDLASAGPIENVAITQSNENNQIVSNITVESLIKVTDLTGLEEISDEQLAKAVESIPERRNFLIELQSHFNVVMNSEMQALIQIEAESIARAPVESLTDLVKRVHASNAQSKFIVDQPRQRVAPVIPPIRK